MEVLANPSEVICVDPVTLGGTGVEKYLNKPKAKTMIAADTAPPDPTTFCASNLHHLCGDPACPIGTGVPLQALQVGLNFCRGLIANFAILLQCFADDVIKLFREGRV